MVGVAEPLSLFNLVDFDNHEQVVFHREANSGLKAIVAIHNTQRGPALGGCRMWPYAHDGEAVRDVLRLSRGMTYKAALSNLPFGGGKAVIVGDARTQKSDKLLKAMGRFVDSLGGRYIVAEDVGMTVADMDTIQRVTPHVRGCSRGGGNPAPSTAFGVFIGILAAVKYRMRRNDVAAMRFAVQGLGNVGYRLCKLISEAGGSLIVTDVDEQAMQRAADELGALTVDVDEIYSVEADVFVPCALGAILNDATIPQLKTGIIAGSANNQLERAEHGWSLQRRGILYAPDYVINAGGLIDVATGGMEHSKQTVLDRVVEIGSTLEEIFCRADQEKVATSDMADRIAEERIHSFSERSKSVVNFSNY